LRAAVFTSRLVPGAAATAAAAGAQASASGDLGLDPRAATRVAVTRSVSWLATFGVAHQPPSLFVPIPGLTIGRLASGLQTSLQAGQGVEVALPLDFKVTATLFLHDYLGLTDATATCIGTNGAQVPNSAGNDCLAQRVNGRAFGLELLARRDLTKRISGWLSYTLSRSTRQTRGVVVNTMSPLQNVFTPSTTPTFQEIPAEFDRTHVLNVVGAIDLGRGWRAGARAMVYSGRPYTRTMQGVPVPPFNSERLPPFYRFDIRLEKRWRAFGDGYVAMVLEGMNVTLTKEAISAQCRSDGSFSAMRFDTCDPQYIGPVTVPSIGVEAAL
jgi:hypothetical protein